MNSQKETRRTRRTDGFAVGSSGSKCQNGRGGLSTSFANTIGSSAEKRQKWQQKNKSAAFHIPISHP